MNTLDYIIVIAYIAGFLFLGYFFKNNKDSDDYFLGGRSMHWFPLSLSTMATQLSAISFVSAPAFVGLAMGRGMEWLTFELAVPLSMIFIMIVLIPPLYRSGVVSIYEYVERRYNTSTRIILSVVFQISRALGTGVMVYTIAIILQATMNTNFHFTILIIGAITLIYSYQGGMKAVVWGDALQMLILFAGLLICLFYGWNLVNENGGLAMGLDRDRLEAIDMSKWGFSHDEYGVWPMIIGGFFLYASYYGCDQTQAQRLLSAKNENTIEKLLLANGLLRFPVVLIYCLMGLIVGTLAVLSPDFMQSIAEVTATHFPEEYAEVGFKSDLMIPVFIIKYLPHGIIGILIIGILSAAMSSLSSTITSLSAVTTEDIFLRARILKNRNNPLYMKVSKYLVLFWGVVCIAAAYLFGGSESTVIEIINEIGSLFYGPILATFVLAVLSRKVSAVGINAGIILSVAINLIVKYVFPNIFWIWFNFFGFLLCCVIAYLVSIVVKRESADSTDILYSFEWKYLKKKSVIILVLAFVAMFAISYTLPSIF